MSELARESGPTRRQQQVATQRIGKMICTGGIRGPGLLPVSLDRGIIPAALTHCSASPHGLPTMRVSCRHCQNAFEIADDHAGEILCSVCGSTFRLDEMATPTFVEPQRRAGKFQLLGRLGTGASAAVWRARDTELHRTVALKIMHASLLESQDSRERFYREARAAAQLVWRTAVSWRKGGDVVPGIA